MPLFALPLPPTATTSRSRTQFSDLPIRKRKRLPSPTFSDNDEQSLLDAEPDTLPASITNPLSLTPDEIAQYKLAGLELNERVPGVKDFPHRGLGERFSAKPKPTPKDLKGKGKEKELDETHEGEGNEGAGEEEVAKKKERGPLLRLQHLGVLTAILHRCLLEGDIPRASRAWAMLIRAEVGGHAIDIRGSGYWGIGAELLVRSLDRFNRRKRNDDEIDSEDQDQDGNEEVEGVGEKRWGTKEGLEKAKDYYERLILQYPYKRQFHGSVSALDFWPAMLGCEVYGIQYERKEGLRRAVEKEEGEEDGLGSESEQSEEGLDEEEDDGGFVAEEGRKLRRRRRKDERLWRERDEIRQTALAASEKIAARMDELMTAPPYSDSHVLLRLRGMIALYIGHLSVPALPVEEDDETEGAEMLERQIRLGTGGSDTERRLLWRQRLAEHEKGKKKQQEERTRAKKLFDRIRADGGRVGGNLSALDDDDDNDEYQDAEE